MKFVATLIFSMTLVCTSMAATAEILPPDELVKKTVKEVLELISQNKHASEPNPKKLMDFIDAKVLPHFNFERMTKLAVGKYWRTATPEQKAALIVEFRALLVRTYIKALTTYTDVSVETKPVAIQAGTTEVTVKTVILRPSAPPIPANYEMEKTDGGWKMFDLTVEGISLVSTHRNSFGEKVKQEGIDGLIKSLMLLNSEQTNAKADKAVAK
jgi:phospholipid transport system substrate-binding protein